MKEIRGTDKSYQELKFITDKVYSGERSEYGRDVLALLQDYGVKARQKDGILHSINLSIPKSIDSAIVVGFRYKKVDGTFTEDHFLFQHGKDLCTYYKNSFEKVAPEYRGAHKDQLHHKSETSSDEKAAWVYLSKELALINVAVDTYEKLFNNIEVNDNAYNQAIQLLLDSLSYKIIGGLSKFIDKTRGTWSLYTLGVDRAIVDKIRLDADELIMLRHKQVAHFAADYSANSFLLLADGGIKISRSTIAEIHRTLSEIGRDKYDGNIWALHWAGIDQSVDLLIEYITPEKGSAK